MPAGSPYQEKMRTIFPETKVVSDWQIGNREQRGFEEIEEGF
jgi:hypothetical protein